MTINWKEVCKFLSGAFFVSAGVLFYLYLAGSPVPVLGAHLAVTPTVNGVRAAVHAVLFVVFFYLGSSANRRGPRHCGQTRLGR